MEDLNLNKLEILGQLSHTNCDFYHSALDRLGVKCGLDHTPEEKKRRVSRRPRRESATRGARGIVDQASRGTDKATRQESHTKRARRIVDQAFRGIDKATRRESHTKRARRIVDRVFREIDEAIGNDHVFEIGIRPQSTWPLPLQN